MTAIQKNMMPAVKRALHSREPLGVAKPFEDINDSRLLFELFTRARCHGSPSNENILNTLEGSGKTHLASTALSQKSIEHRQEDRDEVGSYLDHGVQKVSRKSGKESSPGNHAGGPYFLYHLCLLHGKAVPGGRCHEHSHSGAQATPPVCSSQGTPSNRAPLCRPVEERGPERS